MSSALRIVLIQARTEGDPMAEHERQCFCDGCDIDRRALETFNVATDAVGTFDWTGLDGVVIGGSGDFSLVEGGFPWHGEYLDLIRDILRVGLPTFGSCFGFQGIVQAMGGRLATDRARSEVGTYAIELMDEATRDPLFGELPDRFDAQLGHNDSVVELSDELVHLARSERCEYQAIRVRGRPVVATQFHPELSRQGSLARFRNYLESYKQPDQDFEEAMADARRKHRPSRQATALLTRFVRRLRGEVAA